MDVRAPRWGDIAIAAALLVLALIGILQAGSLRDNLARPYDLLGVVLVVAQLVPLAWRQSYPRIVVWATLMPWLVAVGMGYMDTAAMWAIYVALYGLATYMPRRVALAHGAAVLAVMLAWTTVGLLVTDFVKWTALVAVALAVVVPMMLGFVDHRRRERLTELELEHERRDQAQRAVAQDAVRAERARIARELHDVVAHEITVMTLQAEGARRLARDSDARVLEALGTIAASGRTGLAEMQRMIGVLRATEQEAADTVERDRAALDMQPMPALAAIPALTQQVADAGLPVELSIVGTAHVPAGVELNAYRVVQEGLTNAMKHAGPGARATVTVDREPARVLVVIEDDGRGVISDAASQSGGHGLRGMAERVHALGGTLEYGPRQGGGFRVRAVLPSTDDQVGHRSANTMKGGR
ncbi:sensor histidine kinase [Demequina iriomotensis]|uniref:sensor histidine kinase n=1 Tax=Demequina iriomotensis TaxID=1536641 RepID=UPI0007815213|nr:sensor histidine kinase [Demequina iriomotensis]